MLLKQDWKKNTLEVLENDNVCELLLEETIFEEKIVFKIEILKKELSMEVRNILDSTKFFNDISFEYFTMKNQSQKMKAEIEDLKIKVEKLRYSFNNLIIILLLVMKR